MNAVYLLQRAGCRPSEPQEKLSQQQSLGAAKLVKKRSQPGMNLAHLLLRVRGVGAITDPEVASALRLSESQVVRIKDVQRANSASLKGRIRALFGRGF